jgi:Holliday junction DNA helicase RuvA
MLLERAGDRVLIDCSGVGYSVLVSGHTAAGLPAEGEELVLRIFTHTNSQDMRTSLFGFGSLDERELFDLLITVKKVGPTAAMGILSGAMAPVDIAGIIADENTTALTKIRGVGKKTAELIIVELKDKCDLLLARWAAEGRAKTSSPRRSAKLAERPPMLDDVATALVQMGFRPSEADQAVASLIPVPDGATLELLLRDALQAIPRVRG